MDKRTLTYDKAGQRWKKIYRGRVWYGERGMKKSDKVAYQAALNAFQEWRQIADTDADAHKPHADQYHRAIALRQAMLHWLNLERDNREQFDTFLTIEGADGQTETISGESVGLPMYAEEYDRLVKELDRLKVDFARLTPPELDTPNTLTIDPIAHRSISQQNFWRSNIKELQAYNRWIGTTDHAQTIGANLDEFLAGKRQQAESGQVSYGWYNIMSYQVLRFRQQYGDIAVENLNANLVAGYHSHLLDEIKAGRITSTYARGLFNTVKQFVRWLDDNEVIEKAPRNVRTLQIVADAPTIKTLTTEEINTLLASSTERTRLFILLMLNTGMTGIDISDLKPSEVDWKHGRIIRKRSKTKREKTVPIVNYKLWQRTTDLLKRLGNIKGERVFLTATGQPLRRWEDTPNGTRNLNAVGKAWENLTIQTGIRKPLKLLRKTSASTLAKHHTYGQFAFLFLGHSPKTTAERHYIQVPQDLFDEAVTWLGQQYGIE